MLITITKCEEKSDPASTHKEFFVAGKADDELFSVTVLPFCSEYHYERYPVGLGDDDESLQIAIGQHFGDNDIDVGRVGR
jgi:hypothetical protein